MIIVENRKIDLIANIIVFFRVQNLLNQLFGKQVLVMRAVFAKIVNIVYKQIVNTNKEQQTESNWELEFI